MNTPRRPHYREGTRAARFLRLRDAIMTHAARMRPVGGGLKELAVGPFLIVYAPPGAYGVGRGYNLNIWPDGAPGHGHILQGNKVANVDWNQWDAVADVSHLARLKVGAKDIMKLATEDVIHTGLTARGTSRKSWLISSS